MATLPIAIVVDVDPDWRVPGLSGRPWAGELSWRGVKEGIPRMLDSVRGLRDSAGGPVKFTWLLRSDEQMGTLTGDPAYVATEFRDLWRERLAAGDEVGWHPHQYRFSEQHRVWFQETRDLDWMVSTLRSGHAALSRHFPIHTAKTGWTFHNNATMETMSRLGVAADVSAIPGLRYDGAIPGTGLPFGVYDWSRAPQEPYRPRKGDYQMPGDQDALSIVEFPNWTFPLSPMKAALRGLKGRSARDFANAAKSERLTEVGFTRPPWTVPFLCYFHPEELLGYAKLFGGGNVLANLRALLNACARRGQGTRFATVHELMGAMN